MGFAVTSYKDKAVGILSARIVSLDQTLNLPEKETQVDVDEGRYNMFLDPSTEIDKALLTKFIDPINAQKQIIVDNGNKTIWDSNEELYNSESSAFSALDTIYGAISDPDGVLSNRQVYTVLTFTGGVIGTMNTPTPPTASESVDTAVIQSGNGTGKVAFQFNSTSGVTARLFIKDVDGSIGTGDTVFIGSTSTGSFSAIPNIVEYLGVGEVYEDIDVAHFYPNLEPPDPSVNDIFGGLVNQIITTSNAGTGFGNTFFPNSLDTTPTYGEFVNVNSSPNKLGDVFTFNTSSGSSNKSDIDTSKNQLNILRNGDPSDSNSVGVSSYNAAGVNIKKQKRGHAVNTWSGKRMRVVATNDKAGYETSIAILNDKDIFSQP